MPSYTTQEAFLAGYETLNATFKTGKTKDMRWRKWQLKQIYWMLTDHEARWMEALKTDMNRHPLDAVMYDINGVKGEVITTLGNVDKWAKGSYPEGAGILFGYLGGAWLREEPLGVCLIIGAWNFPMYTVLSPTLAAIAAGNCVVLKPSESASAVQDLLVELAPKYLDQSALRVVTGGPAEMSHVLTHSFQHIFYTGGGRVGRIIATAAAKHLTPVVLELGGQAPAIVTKNANIDLAAKHIAHAKLVNAGQVCLNVNHVFVDPSVHDDLVNKMKEYLTKWLSEGTENLTTIISPTHWSRISRLLEGTVGKTVYTGPHNEKAKFIHPTIVTDVQTTDSLMSEELFAPLVPVLKADVETAIKTITSMPHPLGLYVFSKNQKEIDHILNNTNSGGVTINDAMIHAGVPGAPFGGVGESGYGSYHGKFGFDAFSHTRTVVGLPDWLEMVLSWRYGPQNIENRKYTDSKPSFKRGETLQDQRAGKTGFLGLW